jgi:hypothetical protein
MSGGCVAGFAAMPDLSRETTRPDDMSQKLKNSDMFY